MRSLAQKNRVRLCAVPAVITRVRLAAAQSNTKSPYSIEIGDAFLGQAADIARHPVVTGPLPLRPAMNPKRRAPRRMDGSATSRPPVTLSLLIEVTHSFECGH